MDSALNRIKHTAQGRWPEIFAAAGMDPGHFVKSNRPCRFAADEIASVSSKESATSPTGAGTAGAAGMATASSL